MPPAGGRWPALCCRRGEGSTRLRPSGRACAAEARSRTVEPMTESTYRMRLLSVHPLDAPVVALATSMTEGAHARGRGRLTAVGAVRCHGSRELDTFHAADSSAMTALAGFAAGSPIVAHGLADALSEDAASVSQRGGMGRTRACGVAHAGQRRRLARAAGGAPRRERAGPGSPSGPQARHTPSLKGEGTRPGGRRCGRAADLHRVPGTGRTGAGPRGRTAATPRRPADTRPQPARGPRVRACGVARRGRRRSHRRHRPAGDRASVWSVPAASACRSRRSR